MKRGVGGVRKCYAAIYAVVRRHGWVASPPPLLSGGLACLLGGTQTHLLPVSKVGSKMSIHLRACV